METDYIGAKTAREGPEPSNRADLVRLIQEDDLLLRHVPPQQGLGHRVNLVVVGAVRERRAFLDESFTHGIYSGCGR